MPADPKADAFGHAPVLGPSNGRLTNGHATNGAAPTSVKTHLPAGFDTDAAHRALDVLGQRWNLLILGAVFDGVHRFREIERRLGIPRKTLAQRLKLLVSLGLLVPRRYDLARPRFEYRPTRIGWSLQPAVAALAQWGDEYERYLCAQAGAVVTRPPAADRRSASAAA